MELNKKDKFELREYIKEKLELIPDGSPRIDDLPKEELESFIFHTLVDVDENGNVTTYKYPICTGSFLRKLDLSKISFDNVYFDQDLLIDILADFTMLDYRVLEENDYPIDFSYTNAPISTIFKRKDNHVLRISNCNFEGVDLSNVTLYLTDFGLNTNGFSISLNNNFKNTGIRLITTNKVVNKVLNSHDESIKAEKEQEARDIISKMIALGYLDGCYIDGYLVENTMITDKQEPNRKEELLKQYEELLIQKKNIWDESIGKVRK